ncbi:MAG: hypothetical protein IT376_09010 [Polyangiaceae bacterium]|nr:hypothetical protein [Polyangiaceae bacterium]
MTWDVGRVLHASVGALFALQLAAAAAAVGLLGRMAPPVQRIAADNVASLHHVEEMALALASGESSQAARFEAALAAARANVTEEPERVPLEILDRERGSALAGDPVARARVLDALGRLGAANREAIGHREVEAGRLGTAGAWTVVGLALLGAIVAAVVLRRIERQVLAPLRRLGEVASGVLRGETHRRCHSASGVAEIRESMRVLNELLDEREATREAGREGRSDRALLLGLLDAQPRATAVVDGGGRLLAASRSWLALVGGEAGEAVGRALREGAAGAGGGELEAIPIGGDGVRWVSVTGGEGTAATRPSQA